MVVVVRGVAGVGERGVSTISEVVGCVRVTDPTRPDPTGTHHRQAGVVARPAREARIARLQRQRERPEHVLLALVLGVDGGRALVRDRLGAARHLPGEPRRHDHVGPTVELGGVPAGEGVALAGDLADLVPVVFRVVAFRELVEGTEREAAVLVAARAAAHRSVVVRPGHVTGDQRFGPALLR